MYRLRDERGVYSDIWASGLMRRAALAAGRRVASRGRIDDPVHMVDAGLDEMCALVTGFRRAVGRRARGARRVPRHAHRQGRAPVPRRPAAPAARPVGAAARCIARVMTRHRHRARLALRELGGRARARTSCAAWPRARASTKARRGSIAGPSEFGRIQQGDVLVTASRRPRRSTSCCRCSGRS